MNNLPKNGPAAEIEGLTGLQRFFLGSVSSKLSHHATASVMVVRDG